MRVRSQRWVVLPYRSGWVTPERLDALCSLGILDTPPEQRFDRFTRIAAASLQVPIALVSLVDSNRQ